MTKKPALKTLRLIHCYNNDGFLQYANPLLDGADCRVHDVVRTMADRPFEAALPGSVNRVVHGVNWFYRDLSGWTVGQVKNVFRDELNCSYFAEAIIDGQSAPVSAVLKPGQDLEFLKLFGFKGNAKVPRAILEARGLLNVYPELNRLVTDSLGRALTGDESDVMALATKFFVEKFGPLTQESAAVLKELAKQIERISRNLSDERITNASLTGTERAIVETISDAAGRLTTTNVLSALSRAGRTAGESSVKAHLASLVKRGILDNCKRCDPAGYGLNGCVHNCGLYRVRTD
jgi:hypothetical protein